MMKDWVGTCYILIMMANRITEEHVKITEVVIACMRRGDMEGAEFNMKKLPKHVIEFIKSELRTMNGKN